jgi:hypothetical protein
MDTKEGIIIMPSTAIAKRPAAKTKVTAKAKKKDQTLIGVGVHSLKSACIVLRGYADLLRPAHLAVLKTKFDDGGYVERLYRQRAELYHKAAYTTTLVAAALGESTSPLEGDEGDSLAEALSLIAEAWESLVEACEEPWDGNVNAAYSAIRALEYEVDQVAMGNV